MLESDVESGLEERRFQLGPRIFDRQPGRSRDAPAHRSGCDSQTSLEPADSRLPAREHIERMEVVSLLLPL
jgi:hypothetical protein